MLLTHACTHTHRHVHTHIHAYVHTHTYIHTYTYTYTHTHTHTTYFSKEVQCDIMCNNSKATVDVMFLGHAIKLTLSYTSNLYRKVTTQLSMKPITFITHSIVHLQLVKEQTILVSVRHKHLLVSNNRATYPSVPKRYNNASQTQKNPSLNLQRRSSFSILYDLNVIWDFASASILLNVGVAFPVTSRQHQGNFLIITL